MTVRPRRSEAIVHVLFQGYVGEHTAGHSPEDITALVGTAQGVVAFTHLWWASDGPAEDPYATDPEALHAGRRRVLEIADLILPAHGPMFRPGVGTPR